MDFNNVQAIVARKSGLNLAQNTQVITTAIMGALEEIGVHFSISNAIKSNTLTLTASDNKVIWNTEYARFISVIYEYASGGSDYQRPLTKAAPTEFDYMNRGKQGETTDGLTHYTARTGKIYVGPGSAKTGGSIIVTYQRKLVANDISDLPDANMVIWGALANLLPVDNPDHAVYRTMFINAMAPAAVASEPVKEEHDRIQLPSQILADMDYLDSLGE
jgi:hypothetical protein